MVCSFSRLALKAGKQTDNVKCKEAKVIYLPSFMLAMPTTAQITRHENWWLITCTFTLHEGTLFSFSDAFSQRGTNGSPLYSLS